MFCCYRSPGFPVLATLLASPGSLNTSPSSTAPSRCSPPGWPSLETTSEPSRPASSSTTTRSWETQKLWQIVSRFSSLNFFFRSFTLSATTWPWWRWWARCRSLATTWPSSSTSSISSIRGRDPEVGEWEESSSKLLFYCPVLTYFVVNTDDDIV